MRKSLIALDPWAGAGESFNTAAATAVYKSMSAMDEGSALVYGRILVAGSVHHDLIAHRQELANLAQEVTSGRAHSLRAHYTRSAVDKARAGKDATHEIACLVQIGKAFDFTAQQRTEFTAARHREGGRFVAEHHRIDTDDSKPPLDPEHADAPKVALGGADLAHYQQAYGQIQDLLAPFHHQDLGALLHLQITSRGGKTRDEQVPVGAKDKHTDFSAKINPGDRIESASVSVRPARTAPGAVFDTFAAAGAPRGGGYVADAYNGVLSPGRLGEFNQARTTVGENEPYSGASRAFGRLERGSRILQDSMGDQAPTKLQYALAVANHVGQYGPEAQKVIGPSADRAAYRYRGTERAPDPALRNAFAQLKIEGFRGADLRTAAVEGVETADGWNPGPVLRYFRRHLPNADLNELQRRSGVIPPSEGIVIGSDGQVAAQSVGFADDWYLPFNLRHLASLKGGEYIRTRSFGGPTTEDIYTAMVAGAKSLTVVSHNGTYTVDFDRNLRGGRRFNDKAARMVGRYGQLLDSLRSGQVGRGDISPSRMSELRDAAREFEPDENSPAYRDRLTQLATDERRNPTLSRQESSEAATEWLGTVAARRSTRDGRTMTPDELTAQVIDEQAKTEYLAGKESATRMGVEPVLTAQQYQQSVRDRVRQGSPAEQIRAVADLMGQRPGFDKAMGRAADATIDRVSPLQLDGKGYGDALTALQEQFPYYIASVSYHPWRGAVGIAALTDRTLEGSRDTGYVAPRHSRPQQAEAGFFNTDVTGRGKVRADSVRFQNFRVGRGRLRDARERPAATPAPAAASATAPTGTAGGGDDAARSADLAMLDELLGKKRFDSGAALPVNGTAVDYSGGDIRAEVAHPQFPHAGLRRLYRTPRAELEAMPGGDLHTLLEQVVGAAQGPNRVFAVNDAAVQTFRNKGKAPAPQPVRGALGDMLREIESDHSYPGIAYDPLRPPPAPEVIERVYGSEPGIRRLRDRGELPAVSDPAFTDKIGPLQTRLAAASAEHARVGQAGGRADRDAVARDTRDADSLLRAAQLHRRWSDADAHRPPPPPAAAEPATTTTNQFIAGNGVSLEDLQRLFDNAGAADQRTVIDGS